MLKLSMTIRPRKSFTELPTEAELAETFNTEAQRPVPRGKEDLHFATLDPLLKFLNQMGTDSSLFNLDKGWREALSAGQDFIDRVVPFILNQDRQKIATLARTTYRYLAEDDQMEPADLILAFGAKTLARAERAVELYKQGIAPKLLFSGGSPIYNKTKPEAETYREIALEAGVPDKDILLEINSITLPDNVRSSLNLLDDMGFTYKTIVLVNSPYAQRRGFGHMQKYTPEGVKILRVNSPTRAGLREDDWFTNEEGVKYVLHEYGKIWIALTTNTI